MVIKTPGFKSKKEAEIYANDLKLILKNCTLYKFTKDSEKITRVKDQEIFLSRLKSDAINRIKKAHKKADHKETALLSIKEFEKTGKSDLVIDIDDFEKIEIPVSKWHKIDGLNCGFESLGYGIE